MNASYGAAAINNTARLSYLAMGFGLIMLAAFKRVPRGGWGKFLPVFAIVAAAVAFTSMHAPLMEHARHVTVARAHIFRVVCGALVIAGYILGRHRTRQVAQRDRVVTAVAVCVFILPGLLLALMNLEALSAQEMQARTMGGNPVGVAYTIANLAMVLLVALVFSSGAVESGLYSLGLLLAVALVVCSASRGAVLGGMLAGMYVLFLSRKRWLRVVRSRRFLRIAGAVAIIGIGFLAYAQRSALLQSREDLLTGRLQAVKQYAAGERGPDLAMKGRLLHLEEVLENVGDWWIIGKVGYARHPHNQYLEFLVRFGVFIGGIAIVWSVRNGMRLATLPYEHKFLRDNMEFVLIAGVFAYSYLQSMTSLTLEQNRVMWLGFGYVMGLARACAREAPSAERQLRQYQQRGAAQRRSAPTADHGQPRSHPRERRGDESAPPVTGKTTP
jgi:O-antigen ligase